jgi:hypothetical protein
MKKELANTQKKDVKPPVKVKRCASKRTNSKELKAVTAAEEVPETIEQPAEQQAVPHAADAAAVIPPLESNILQDGTNQAEVAAATESAAVTELSPEPQAADTVTVTIIKESKMLRERLGLQGYITETVKLPSRIEVLSSQAESVVFAKQINGFDRVLLHVSLVDGAGKRSIVSSRKKVPLPEWQAVTEALTGMAITWRDRELKRAVK